MPEEKRQIISWLKGPLPRASILFDIYSNETVFPETHIDNLRTFRAFYKSPFINFALRSTKS